MAETAFDLTYDGDAIVEGRMPVRDLAPALLALGEIFAEASDLIAPERPPASLSIEATGKGSFVVHLIVGGWDHIIDIFSSKDADALVVLKESIVGACGLFAFTKAVGRRLISRADSTPDPGKMVIKFEDGTSLEVPTATWELYGRYEVRKKSSEVIKPLLKDGVDRLDFRVDREVTVSLGPADADAFEAPTAPLIGAGPLGSETLQLVVSIVSVAFKDDNKWRLSDGSRTFFALIRDDAFLAGVASGREAFRAGDMLRCRLRIVQTSDGDGLHSEYEVIEVLEHLPRPQQLRLGEPGQQGEMLQEERGIPAAANDDDDDGDAAGGSPVAAPV